MISDDSGIYYCLKHATDIMRKVPDAYSWGEHIEKIPEHCVNSSCNRAGCRKVNRDYLINMYKLWKRIDATNQSNQAKKSESQDY